MSCHTLPLPLTLPLACQYGELSFVDEFLRQEVDRTTTVQTSTKVKRYATNGNGTNNVNHNTNASTSGRRVNENNIPYSSPWYEIESHDAVGLTPLHLATIYQQRPIVEKLLTAETSTGRDGKDGTVVSTLSSSSTFGSLASRLLLTTDLESRWTALHHALYRGDFLTAHLLRRAGANLNCLDHDGMTPIDLVTNHQAESVRRREANGLGRVAASNAGIGASSISKKMFKASGNELGSTSAFAALAKEERTDEDEKSFNLLYSYGYQSNYTLGYTCDHYQHRPRLLDSCASSSVVQVLALKQFVFILLSDGTVMSHGQGHSGKLGHQERETLIQPKRIAALHDITHIAGTDDYICAVNAKGAVFMFGYSMFIDAPGAMAIPNKSNSNTSANNAASRLQPSSHSPPPATRSLDVSSSSSSSSTSAPANATVSSSLGVIRYSQLPRRVESLRSLAVRRLFPSTHRLIMLTDSGDLWFIGQSIEDVERWESQPKRFAAPIHETIIDITNRDEFVAILTVSGSIRLQRRGERKLNKIWLQNYVDVPRNDDRKQFRHLFPLIPPKQHVVSMAWSSPSISSSSSVDSRQSYNGACVTREGQVFAWKLPQATDGGKVYPRCIGYLVQGLASIRAVDVAVAMRHTCVVTEDGHVYTFGPETIGITRPNEVNGTTLTNSSISTSRMNGEDSLTSLPSSVSSNSILTPNSSVVSLVHTPRRLMHLTQVRQVVLSDQYVMAIVGIRSIPIAPSFTELHGVIEDDNFPRLRHRRHLSNGEMSDDSFIRCEVPSLRLLCQYKLASEMTPLSLLQAYEWACQTSCEHLRHYCTRYLLANMSFYLPSLLALDDVASLVYLQQQYAEHHPLWFSSPQWNQPLQQLSSSYTNDNHLNQPHASSLLTSTSTSVSSSSSPFLFPSAFSSLSQSTLHHPPSTGSSIVVDTEERVDAIKLRRRAVVKKLGQIAGIMNSETTPSHVRTKLSHPLDAAQREKIAQRDRYEKELEELERELSALCQRGSVAANELWEKLHPTPTSTSAPSSSPPAPTPSTSTNITDSSTSSFSSSSSIEHLPASDTDTASLLLPTDPSTATPSSSTSSSSSRVASALFDRPVRPLNQSSHHEKANQTPLSLSSSTKFKGAQNDRSTAQPPSSSTTTTTLTSSPLSSPSPSPTRPTVTPTMSPVLATTANAAPMSTGKWKSATQTSNLTPLHATSNTTAATTGTASISVSSSPSLHSPVILPTSSLAEIQKEEEAKAKLLDAKSRKMPRPSSSSSTSISSSSIISSSISGKGWGAAPANQMSTPVLVSTPVISTLNSHDRDSMNDFPSLAAVASHSPPLKPTRNGSMGKLSSPLVRPSSNVAISGSPPSSSASGSSFGQPHTSQPGVFSLADFMPTLPSKLKVASTPVKTWNIPTVNNHVSANVAAGTGANTTTAAASSVDPNTSASSKDGKKKSKSHHGKSQHPSASASATADPSPSSTVTSTPSFLSIQAAEAARFYGPASAFKTQRELDLEFEYCQASLGGVSRPAWNIAPSALGSSGLTLLDVQQQEQAALLQAAARERQREEKAARKKAKQAEAKQREIEAAQLAKALKQTKLEARAAGATSKEEQVPTNNNNHNNNNNNGKQKSHQRPKSGKTKHNGSHQHNHPSNSANCEDSNTHPHVDDSSNTTVNPSSNSVHPSTSQSSHPKSARSRKTHSNHSNDSTVAPNHTTNPNPNLNPDSNSNLLNGVRDNSAQKSSRPRGPPQSTRQHTKNQPTNQSSQHQQQRQAAPANGTPAGSQ